MKDDSMADLERIGITPGAKPGKAPYLRIAAEEAFCPPEMFEIYAKILDQNLVSDPGFQSLWGFYLRSPSPRTTFIRDHMTDLSDRICRSMPEASMWAMRLSPRSVIWSRMKVVRGLGLRR